MGFSSTLRAMHTIITGGTGFIGSRLVEQLRLAGHVITVLTRSPQRVPDGIHAVEWNPESGDLDPRALSAVDAVVHLAGAGIADARWTSGRRAAILNSRVDGTRLLVSALREGGAKPAVFISASAVGYYGDTGEQISDETAPTGEGFAAEVCRAWEAEADAAVGIAGRVVRMRFGTVLDPAGGAISRMLPLFRFGLGGRLGSGRQWMSCISLDDAVSAVAEAISNHALQGPVNVVAPEPIRNSEFTRALASGLGKRVGPPVPGIALRVAFGQMAGELLLGSSRVVPGALEATGFVFKHPDVATYLEKHQFR